VAELEEQLAAEQEKCDELTSQRNSAVRKLESVQQDLKRGHVRVAHHPLATPPPHARRSGARFCVSGPAATVQIPSFVVGGGLCWHL
jgi:hypothetical protein